MRIFFCLVRIRRVSGDSKRTYITILQYNIIKGIILYTIPPMSTVWYTRNMIKMVRFGPFSFCTVVPNRRLQPTVVVRYNMRMTHTLARQVRRCLYRVWVLLKRRTFVIIICKQVGGEKRLFERRIQTIPIPVVSCTSCIRGWLIKTVRIRILLGVFFFVFALKTV